MSSLFERIRYCATTIHDKRSVVYEVYEISKVDEDEVVPCQMTGTENGVDRVTAFPDMGLYPLLRIEVGLLINQGEDYNIGVFLRLSQSLT